MKKILIVTIIVALLMGSLSVHATATQFDEYAEKLATIGVFKGTGNGYELGRAPSRIEGIIMLIRLLGQEDDALAIPITESVFSDVPGWAIQYTNYAYNSGLTKGIGNGLFGSDIDMNANSYYTYLLRALGYDDSSGDYSWNTAVDFAYSLGMISEDLYSQLKQNQFLRDYVAKGSYDALCQEKKGSSENLLEFLVASGDVDSTTASSLLIRNVAITALDKKAEYIIIKNNGNETVDISGWIVVSVKGNQIFVFPEGTFIDSEKSIILTSGEASGTGDFDMENTTIWNNYEKDDAELIDSTGNRVDIWNDIDY